MGAGLSALAVYRVFGFQANGGKILAVTSPSVLSTAEMQQMAAQSGQPLVAFAQVDNPRQVTARFFNTKREKGPSDSGAMAVAEHFRRLGQVGEGVRLEMGEEGLELVYEDQKWWTLQGDFGPAEPVTDPEPLLEQLGLATHFPAIWSGAMGSSRHNLIVWLPREQDLMGWQPPMESLTAWLESHGTNGLVVAQWLTYPSQVALRFMAPHRGLPEDNAGSYTLASLCGYLSAEVLGTGFYQVEALQGQAMNQTSQLWARFEVEDGLALGVEVGGAVEWLQEGS